VSSSQAARPWTTVGYNLESFIGQTIKIYFETQTCGAGSAYAYVLADCRPAIMESPVCEGDYARFFDVPTGFESYTWTRSSNSSWEVYTRRLAVPDPLDEEIFTCKMSSLGCDSEIKYIVKKASVVAKSLFGVPDSAGNVDFTKNNHQNWYDTCNRTVAFVDSSYAVNTKKDSILWEIPQLNVKSSDSVFIYTFPEPIGNQPVTYRIRLTVFETSCKFTDTMSHYITIYPKPKVKITSEKQVLCRGDSAWLRAEAVRSDFFSHQWKRIDKNEVTHTFTGDSIQILMGGTYTLESVSYGGCTASDTFKMLTLNNAITSYPTTCGEDNGRLKIEILDGSFPYTFKIEKEDGTLVSSSYSVLDLSAGTYIVTVTDANCTTLDTIIIIATPKPYIEVISVVDAICGKYGSIEILPKDAEGMPQIVWSTGRVQDTGSRIDLLEKGNYTVTISDFNYCRADTTIEIKQIDGPVADFTTDSYLVLINFVFTLTDASKGTPKIWDWNMGDGNTLSGEIVQHSYNGIGDYIVSLKVTDTNACVDSISKIMRVYDKLQVFIPNTFTPNADNLNDTWKPFLLEYAKEGYILTLYDRWGNRIFHTTDPNISWDGTINGKPAQNNTAYAYHLIVKDLAGKEHKYTGNVAVVR
jgi:gliding motility-associated-like protein